MNMKLIIYELLRKDIAPGKCRKYNYWQLGNWRTRQIHNSLKYCFLFLSDEPQKGIKLSHNILLYESKSDVKVVKAIKITKTIIIIASRELVKACLGQGKGTQVAIIEARNIIKNSSYQTANDQVGFLFSHRILRLCKSRCFMEDTPDRILGLYTKRVCGRAK